MAEPSARWRKVADALKHNRAALWAADRLGRGKGWCRVLDRWGGGGIPESPVVPDLRGWEERELSVVWLGHASLLIRMGGVTIYTDPVFSNRIGLGLGLMTAGPRRLVKVPVERRELPRPDLVLLSHAHFDHCDLPTLARLDGKGADLVISWNNLDLVRGLGFRSVRELAVGEAAQFGEVKVTAVPVRHWGARVFHDVSRGYCAYLLEAGGRRVLFGADTAYQELWKRIGPVDLAAIGIGAYNPWEASHATPEQAAAMAEHCGAAMIAPIHHSTFKLSHEPMGEPMERLRRVVGSDRIAFGEVGGSWTARRGG